MPEATSNRWIVPSPRNSQNSLFEQDQRRPVLVARAIEPFGRIKATDVLFTDAAALDTGHHPATAPRPKRGPNVMSAASSEFP